MAQMLDHALSYAKRGLPVFPCDASKQPLCDNGVLDATTDPGRIEKWWARFPKANIGCDVTGAGLCVVDFDPGSDMAQVKRDLQLPATEMRQRTPRGGVHLFYAIDEDERVSNSVSKIAPKTDVRGLNGYVLLAPSRTSDGVYSWEAEGAAAFRTDDMLRTFNTAREKDADRDNWLIDPDLPENVEAATKWLREDAKIAVEGQGGDHIAYATAAHLKSYGISQELAFDLMWEHWNPRCDPPWSADEVDHLETKVNNGYSYNTSPPGNITKAYKEAKAKSAFRPVLREGMPSGREFTAGRFRIVDREGMNHIPPARWIIPGLIPQDAYVVMFGQPGTFKSFLAFDMAATVATGASFPWSGAWGDVTEDGPVLYALGEGRAGFTKRVKAWEQSHYGGKQIRNFFLCDPVPLASENLDAFIDGALAASPDGYRLVFVDTVGRSMQGLNENSQEHASKFTAMVQRIQAELGATVIALHHSGHGEDTRGKGSMEFYGAPDATFGVMRKDKEMFVTLTNPKQKDAPEWEKPRRLELREVKLPSGETSLVVFPAGAKPESAAIAGAKQKRGDASIVLVLDALVAKTLEANKVKAWSTRELAQALAMRDELEVDSKTLQNTHLVRIREMKGTKANRSYDPNTKRWKWRE
jgi:KaiC/GvpD/RAD55 family RecA-like ATPase